MTTFLLVTLFSFQAYAYKCNSYLAYSKPEIQIGSQWYDLFQASKNSDPHITGLNSRYYGYEMRVGFEIANKLRRASINDINTIIRVPIEDYKYLGLKFSEASELISLLSQIGITEVLTETDGWIHINAATKYLNY